jgi:hypothetical protein
VAVGVGWRFATPAWIVARAPSGVAVGVVNAGADVSMIEGDAGPCLAESGGGEDVSPEPARISGTIPSSATATKARNAAAFTQAGIVGFCRTSWISMGFVGVRKIELGFLLMWCSRHQFFLQACVSTASP